MRVHGEFDMFRLNALPFANFVTQDEPQKGRVQVRLQISGGRFVGQRWQSCAVGRLMVVYTVGAWRGTCTDKICPVIATLGLQPDLNEAALASGQLGLPRLCERRL
jgi:hypothetical protein